MPDDDDRYSKMSYGSRSTHKSSGGVGVAAGKARGNNKDGNVTQVMSVTNESAKAMVLGDPISYHDVLSMEDCKAGKRHVIKNLKCLRSSEFMRRYLPWPYNHKLVSSKWVFRMKMGPDGQVEHYKACLVAQGFLQVEGINYNETFVPVTKFNSI